MTSKNLDELLKCLKDAGMPHYHHELVYQSIVLALDSSDKSAGETVFELLGKLFMVGEINVTQTTIAYNRLCDDKEDLQLDYHKAPELIEASGKIFKAWGMLDCF